MSASMPPNATSRTGNYTSVLGAIIAAARPDMQPLFRLYRWDEIALEKITEMVSRKFVSGSRETLAQIYLKRGAIVPQHAHESEQMTYVLQGSLKLLVGGEEVTVREGEVLHIPPQVL